MITHEECVANIINFWEYSFSSDEETILDDLRKLLKSGLSLDGLKAIITKWEHFFNADDYTIMEDLKIILEEMQEERRRNAGRTHKGGSMNEELRTLDQNVISSLVIKGDLKGLTPNQKFEYYCYRCQQAGLDPAAKPFDLLVLNGKEVLYANAGCTQQLTAIHKLSHTITGRELTDGIYCVFCRVTGPDGRSTENMGAVPVENLKGEAKANAMLKATTKAIRRTVLAHCGLGMMDETEVETIPGATKTELPAISEAPQFTYEWSDEERKEAFTQLGGLADSLMEWGVDEAGIQKVIDTPRLLIGDETVSYQTWQSRFAGLCIRSEKKYKPAA